MLRTLILPKNNNKQRTFFLFIGNEFVDFSEYV